MNVIASAADLQELRRLPRALVFIYVNWAGQARQSEIACRKFLALLQRAHPGEPVPAYRADLSDQEGEVWIAIRNWLKDESQPFDDLTYGGCGPMLWVRLGAVAARVPHVAAVEGPKLLAMTRGVFEFHAESGTSGHIN
jgi:hypothetical protein